MKKFLWLGVMAMVLFAGSEVFAESDGSKGAAFLKLGQGAKAIGMGEAFVASADDVNALYWNPAGIAQIKERELTFMYADWLKEIKYNYLAYAQPVQMLGGVMGGAVTLLDAGSMDGRSEGNIPEGTFEGKDMAFSVSYARGIREDLSLGTTLKYIRMKIDKKESSGFAADLGCLYKPGIKNLSLGLAIQNLGPELSAFDKEKNELPLNFKLGGAYKLLADALTIAIDVNFPSDNDTNFNLGAEYRFKEMIAIRAGYKTLTKDELKSSGLTYGAGFRLPKVGIGIDYAFCDYDELGDTHRVSLMAGF